MSPIDQAVSKPLPGPLPPGEHVLWQCSPAWQGFGRRVFQIGKITLYFGVIIAWVAVSAFLGGGWGDASRSLVWTLPPALGVILLLAFMAWLYTRATVYTITNKRVIIQSGLAFTTAINLPFSQLGSADMDTFADGTGDIKLSMLGPRILYSMIWPNARPLALKRPTPVLWALPQPQQVAEILARALAEEQHSDPQLAPQGSAPGSDHLQHRSTA